MKKLLSFAIALFLVLAPGTNAFADVGVSINGSGLQFTQESGQPFVDSANRTQVPLRLTMEACGCEVGWNQDELTATVSKDGATVIVPIGESYILKNGERIQNDTEAVVIDGRTYLPIRAVLEAFGATVGWNQSSQTVTVTMDGVTVSDPAEMTIHFIDVGQGDSTFIDYGDFEILVDAGENSYGSRVASYIRPYVDGSLDVVIATHPDSDHVGGLDDVIRAFQVDKIIDSGDSKDTATYNDYYTAAKSEPGCEILQDSDMTISMGGDAYIRIIETGDGYSDSNANSVVAQLCYNDVSVLLTGDMESDVESKNLSKFSNVDVLKAGHHGSSTSSSQSFLNVVKPEYIIVSAGTDNQYGHPHKEALSRFAQIGATTYGTFKDGTIVMTTDGRTYSFDASFPVTVADSGNESTVTTPPTDNNTTPPADQSGSFIGNKNSKIFHIPDCGSVSRMSESNKVYLDSRDSAISLGYTPCKTCNP